MDAVTPRVFCAVSATIADMPWVPQRANALRSAWMPAPPPESDDATVRTRGTVTPGPLAARREDSTRGRASGGEGARRPVRRARRLRPAAWHGPSARDRPRG